MSMEGMARSSSHHRRRRSGPPPSPAPKPPPPPAACKCPGAGPCTPGWHTFESTGTCIEQDAAWVRVNQNCSRACAGFAVGVPWDSASTQRPAGSVATAAAKSWAWSGTQAGEDHHTSNVGGLKGALEFITGDRTHCTMVYFEASGGNITTGALAIQEALRWVATQHSWLSEAIPVQQALRYMWGCGPACKSSSALVDVDSQLARMKYGLMDHFATLGASVQNTSWGGTAHIQTVSND